MVTTLGTVVGESEALAEGETLGDGEPLLITIVTVRPLATSV